MAETHDIETNMEEGIINLLASTMSIPVISWDDVKNIKLDPVVKVKASPAVNEIGTWNTYSAIRILVQISAFTSRRQDETARHANKIRAEFRKIMSDDEVVENLNEVLMKLQVYQKGVIPKSGIDQTEDLHNQRGQVYELVVLPLLT